jgi:hypothetical protein
VALGLLLWAPPVIEEVRHRPGNFEIIRDSFSHPADRSVGLGWDALHPLLSYLDPVGLLSDFRATDLEPYRGICRWGSPCSWGGRRPRCSPGGGAGPNRTWPGCTWSWGWRPRAA